MTIFMEDLRTVVNRTEIFCVHPSTFEEVVDVALNDEFNFEADQYGTQWDTSSSVDMVESMDFSHTGEEAELQADEKQRNIRRCHICGKKGIFALAARCESNASISRAIPLPQAGNSIWKSSTLGRRGPPYWERTKLCRTSRR